MSGWALVLDDVDVFAVSPSETGIGTDYGNGLSRCTRGHKHGQLLLARNGILIPNHPVRGVGGTLWPAGTLSGYVKIDKSVACSLIN